jgi:aminoglycoside 6-adenylyltransferase
LQQLPDEMLLGSDADTKKVTFTIMTFFEEGYRIDLTFFPVEKIETDNLHDSLTVVWVDKDGLFTAFPKASDKDYHVLKPDQRAFQEVCNEFWWTITNVAKGLKRGEIIYAKDMMENVVRPVFLQMIFWKIGFENDFQISVGKSGKFISKLTSDTLYAKILNTYSDADIKSNWNALFLMVSVFETIQNQLAKRMHFYLNAEESANSKRYIENLYKE